MPNRLQWWLPWTLLPPLLGAPYGAQHATRVKAVARLEGPLWGTACKKGQRSPGLRGPLWDAAGMDETLPCLVRATSCSTKTTAAATTTTCTNYCYYASTVEKGGGGARVIRRMRKMHSSCAGFNIKTANNWLLILSWTMWRLRPAQAITPRLSARSYNKTEGHIVCRYNEGVRPWQH